MRALYRALVDKCNGDVDGFRRLADAMQAGTTLQQQTLDVLTVISLALIKLANLKEEEMKGKSKPSGKCPKCGKAHSGKC